MRLPRFFLVGASAAIRPMARAAALRAFPAAEVVELKTVGEAAHYETARRSELLVLAEPDPVSVAEANQPIDHTGMPRWAVVILGRGGEDLAEAVPPEDWSVPLIARVFRSAVRQHDLMRENFRLQGDLRTMARRISHDLYTPIGCIYTCSHVLKITLAPNAVPASATMVRNIEESLVEIAQIIDRVSFMLRASADPLVAARCEMAEVVADVMSQLDPQLKKTGATVAQPDSWPEVNGVPQWLQVIWSNLLNNAIKHGGPGAQIRIDWEADGNGHRFSVENPGAGIAPAIEASLFRPFDQLHRFHAPGLGLSIVQRLVDLQGGRCGYERSKNDSSRFYFTLPAAAPSSGIIAKAARSRDQALAAAADQSLVGK